MQTATEKLVRKQFLLSPVQIKKLERLAKKEKKSAAEMVRNAIDAYNPDIPADMEDSELLELVSIRLKEAIERTKKANKVAEKALKILARGKR